MLDLRLYLTKLQLPVSIMFFSDAIMKKRIFLQVREAHMVLMNMVKWLILEFLFDPYV